MGRGSLLEPALLASLAVQSTHGYDLRQTIETLTEGFLSVDTAAVYRALRRLEEDGFAKSTWASGEFGPQRREYELTNEGAALLAQWKQHLESRRNAIDTLLKAIEGATSRSRRSEETVSDRQKDEGSKGNA
jgi:PadR family transcriptional regulator PadR